MKKGMYCVIGDARLSAPRTVDRSWFDNAEDAAAHAEYLARPTGGTLFVVCVKRVVQMPDPVVRMKQDAWRRSTKGEKGS